MNFLIILAIILWIYILTVLKRAKLDFWYFLFGSVGMFVAGVVLLQPLITVPMQRAVAAVSGIMGELLGIYKSFFQYGILYIESGNAAISLYIDYECSGIIEIMAFTSLLWFFPVYRTHEKIVINLVGMLVIFAANVLRIFIICTMIYFFGNSVYFVAHTIIGRLFFYGCSVVLYFYVFTKSQIVRQKVGKVSYHGSN